MEKKPSIMNIRCVVFGLVHSEDENVRSIGYTLEDRIKDYDKEEVLMVRIYVLGVIKGALDILFLQGVIPASVYTDSMLEIQNAIKG